MNHNSVLVRLDNFQEHDLCLHPGDSCHLEATWNGRVAVRVDADRYEFGKRERVLSHLLGLIPDFIVIDPKTWAATAADASGQVVRLAPFTIDICGCTKNLGGWYTKRCTAHQQEIESELAGARCEHGRLLELGCNACSFDGNEKGREDRRYIEETQR